MRTAVVPEGERWEYGNMKVNLDLPDDPVRAARRREAAAWLRRWMAMGGRIEASSVGPRPMTAILLEDRR